MKICSFLLSVILVTGCTSTKNYNTAHNKNPVNMNFINLDTELAYTAHLLEIGYEDPAKAVEDFASMGIDATYFSPKYKLVFNYPEVFILSSSKSDHLIILFVGTDSTGDWIQNAKATNYVDVPIDGTFYIPSGHAGFRRGMYNLINSNFFDEVLSTHIDRYDVLSEPDKIIQITLTGHSQGAGLSQLAAPIVDGYKYMKGEIIKTNNWPYKVRAIYAYAPPYAVSVDGGSWEFMSNNYGDKTYQIIRDSDFVTTAYNVARSRHYVPYRHFGKLIRITRDDKVVAEKTSWGSNIDAPHKNKPHQISGYRHALEKAVEELNQGT